MHDLLSKKCNNYTVSKVIFDAKNFVLVNYKLVFAILLVILFTAVAVLFESVQSLKEKVSIHEKRIENVENLYADLSTQLALVKESIPSENKTVFVIQKDNFSTKTLELDEIYERTRQEIKKCVSDPVLVKMIFSSMVTQSEEKGIPIHVLCTILKTESSFRYDATSCAGASNGRGLMQVSDIALTEYNNHHATKYVKVDMFDVGLNLKVGCWYYKYIFETFNKSNPEMTWSDMYVAYNVGYADYKKNISSYRKGWDPTRKQKYTALKNWTKNLEYYAETILS